MAAGYDRHLELFLPLGSVLGVPRITPRFGDSLEGLRIWQSWTLFPGSTTITLGPTNQNGQVTVSGILEC